MLKLDNVYIPWSRIKRIEHRFGTISLVRIHFTDNEEPLNLNAAQGAKLLRWLDENSVDALAEGEKLLLAKEQQ